MTPEERDQRRQRRHLRRAVFKAKTSGLLQGIVSMLRPGDIAVDCGANRGDITAELASSGAEVHAFEPDPYNLEKLRARFAGVANVRVHEAAVGAEAGTVRLMRAAAWDADPDLASVSSTIIAGGKKIAEGEGIDVEVVDFPKFLHGLIAIHGRVAFVKMDIEGAELALLTAMLQERLFDHIQLTVAETHEHKFHHLRPDYAELRQAMGAAYPSTRVNLDWI